MRNRHCFYSQLFFGVLSVLVFVALPYPWRRLAMVSTEYVLVLLLVQLGRPILPRRPSRAWFDAVYRFTGIATLLCELLWRFAQGSLRLLSGIPTMVLLVLFIFWSLKRLLQCLSNERFVSIQVVGGAVSGYLLLGLAGGILLGVLETIAPGSFLNIAKDNSSLILGTWGGDPAKMAAWSLDFGRIYYFAFVSLTTVGYGDIIPVTPPAQMASVALSISGPLYLALVMGLLISRYTIQEEDEQDQDRYF